MLNVQSKVAEEVIAVVEDLSSTDAADVTREEVERAVSKLKNGKVGSDEIAGEMVKNGGQAMIDWLLELLREVWKILQVSQKEKNAVLIPIHQKKGRKVCNNYGEIPLLSIPGKVLSLILYEKLQAILDPQLLESQCGFGRVVGQQIRSG